MNILITGDLFIPYKTHAVPTLIQQKLTPDIIKAVICTGNATEQQSLDYLRSISQDILYASSIMDNVPKLEYAENGYGKSKQFPLYPGIKFGVTNGCLFYPQNDNQQLFDFAKQKQINVLCTSGPIGVEQQGDIVLLRPGSLTGVYGYPSFALAVTEGRTLKFYLYQLVDGKFTTESISINKEYRQESDSEEQEEQLIEEIIEEEEEVQVSEVEKNKIQKAKVVQAEDEDSEEDQKPQKVSKKENQVQKPKKDEQKSKKKNKKVSSEEDDDNEEFEFDA